MVDQPGINNQVSENPLVKSLSLEGTKLLEQSERINVITYEEFEPFIPLYSPDKTRDMSRFSPYWYEMKELHDRFTQELSINWYQPIIVILSREDPKPVYYLDRKFTRIRADNDIKSGLRDSVPGSVPKSAGVTREDILINASSQDLVAANNTPDQIAYFKRLREVSSFIQTKFVEQNLNPDLKEKLVSPATQPDAVSVLSGNIEFFDDED